MNFLLRESKQYQRDLTALLKRYHATLLEFRYERKIFGNLYIVISYEGVVYTIVRDRGEIYINEAGGTIVKPFTPVSVIAFHPVLAIIESEILKKR